MAPRQGKCTVFSPPLTRTPSSSLSSSRCLQQAFRVAVSYGLTESAIYLHERMGNYAAALSLTLAHGGSVDKVQGLRSAIIRGSTRVECLHCGCVTQLV